MTYLESVIQNLIDENYSITLSSYRYDYVKIRLSNNDRYRNVIIPKQALFGPLGAGHLGAELMLIKHEFEECEAE